VLRRHPLVLARFATAAVEGAVAAVDSALRTMRTDLRERVPPETIDAAVAALEQEKHRLQTNRRAVEVVERALRGERWVPRL
jgi:hypothetical protein